MTTRRRFTLLFLIAWLCLPLIPGQKKPESKLPEQYRLWLEEEVAYIITPTERDVFRKLETDRERDIFIEAFWKHRDPTPGTPGNEFKEEHYRRLSHAREFYGRGTPLPGWKTDRGRIYIILGPPQNIETYDTTTGVYPTEIWFYPGDAAYGLPTGFNIIFFKKHGTGDYIFYSPVDDGPQALLADDLGESARDERAIYQKLANLAPNLAPQTLSLIPGERASLASTQLLGNIFSYPQKKVEDTYAEALLKYKDVIEVDYSANYLASDSFVSIIREPSGRTLVHYSVEPRRIAVNQSGNTYTAHFELAGRVSDGLGNTVFQYVKNFPLTFNKDQIQDIRATSLAIQDMFPLVPGTYRFDLLLKNTISKSFTSAEAALVIPGDDGPLRLGQVLLGYRLDRGGTAGSDFIPFWTGAGQLLVQARKTFTRKDDLILFSQIFGLTDELRAGGRVKLDLFKKDAPILTRTKGIAEYENVADILEIFPLRDLLPDYYKIRLAILDRDGREVLAEDEDFEVTALPDIPRPLVVSKVMPASAAGEYDYDMGVQLLNLKRSKDALVYLEKAQAKNPDDLKYALGLSQCLFMEGQYQRILDLLSPWKGEKATDQVLYFDGKSAHSLGRLDEAIAAYTDYLSRFGLNLEILNLLGNAHYQNGNAAEALRTWKRSLEVNPNQENIKKLVQSIEEKVKR